MTYGSWFVRACRSGQCRCFSDIWQKVWWESLHSLWYHQVPRSTPEKTLHSRFDERARGKSAADTGWTSMLYKGMNAVAKQALVLRSVVLLSQTGQRIRPLGQ
jgi:hypothetical protein